MKIVETNIQFKTQQRQYTRYIVIHHSAGETGDAYRIHEWHLKNGWSGIGYHFVILKDGTIQRGRPENAVGAHCTGMRNYDSIGICLIGNFEVNVPTKQQIEALIWLIRYIRDKYGNLSIQKHSDNQATACPGRLFPYQEVINRLEEEEVPEWMKNIMNDAYKKGLITSGEHKPEETATKWFVLAVALNLLKVIGR